MEYRKNTVRKNLTLSADTAAFIERMSRIADKPQSEIIDSVFDFPGMRRLKAFVLHEDYKNPVSALLMACMQGSDRRVITAVLKVLLEFLPDMKPARAGQETKYTSLDTYVTSWLLSGPDCNSYIDSLLDIASYGGLRKMPASDLTPYLVRILTEMFNKSHDCETSQILSVMAAVAGILEDKFAPPDASMFKAILKKLEDASCVFGCGK